MLNNSWILAGWLEAGLGWLGSRRLTAGPQMTGLLMAGPQMAGPLMAGLQMAGLLMSGPQMDDG